MDQTTIRAAAAGQREAQASLLRQLQDPWFRICRSLLHDDRNLAMEATQESALRLLRDLPRFRGESSFRTFAIGIAVNVCREMGRARARDDRGSRIEASAEPDCPVEREEESLRVLGAIAELPQRQREAVVLRYFEDFTTEQTATAMNCSPGTVKATLFQALRNLRRRLTKLILL